ncbi:MAG: hypothetical protein J6B37_06465 [Clostridia bacterium]|nr:hypothetical protein [Clostridia bacterium]
MAKFCTKCGRPLAEGEVCNCAVAQAPVNPGPQATPVQQNANNGSVNINVTQVAANATGAWTKIKNQIGIGDPLINEGDAFEKGKRIIPDCVKPNDGEVPVRQYQIATLRNRILGITYTKAYGRIQVTNKRVIFRAPGRCLAGRTTLQHEFAIDEIAGIESRREYGFNFWDLIIGLIVYAIGGGIGFGIAGGISEMGQEGFLAFLFSIILAAGAGALFFLVKKKWLLKLLGLGAAVVPLWSLGSVQFSFWVENEFLGMLMFLFAIPFTLISLLTLFLHAIKPNLALIVKTKSASEAIDIRRKKLPIFGVIGGQNEKDDHTGYTEIWPEEDAELSIREIGAMINDIQKLGDFGIEKWKQ